MTLRLDRRKARITARAIEEQRRHRRIGLIRQARVLTSENRECPCTIVDFSVGGVLAIADLTPRIGSRAVVIIDAIGRLDGRVTRVAGNQFAVYFDALTLRKRMQLADEVTWEVNRETLDLADDRRAPRHIRPGRARVVLKDGVATSAKFINESEVGASFAASQRPRPGELADVDDRTVRVARRHETGFAVDYKPGE